MFPLHLVIFNFGTTLFQNGGKQLAVSKLEEMSVVTERRLTLMLVFLLIASVHAEAAHEEAGACRAAPPACDAKGPRLTCGKLEERAR